MAALETLRPGNAFEEHMLRPFELALGTAQRRASDLVRRINEPAFLKQHPAKAVPFAFSKLFDVTLTAARRDGATGFLGNAAVVDLGTHVKPRDSNINVGADGAFYLCSFAGAGYVSLTYDANPGFGTHSYTTSKAASDIFNRAIEDNGGALQMSWFFGHQSYEDKPNICFDVELIDKRRGRRLHEGHLPAQLLCAAGLDPKKPARAVRFEAGSEIEPRVRLLEARMGSLLDTDDAYNAAQFKGCLNIVFKGFKVLG